MLSSLERCGAFQCNSLCSLCNMRWILCAAHVSIQILGGRVLAHTAQICTQRLLTCATLTWQPVKIAAKWLLMRSKSMQVGSPRTHEKFLNREDGSYGPVPMRPPMGILNMPFNSTDVRNLYCAGDSTFPGQGVNAVVFSGFGAAHRALVDQGKAPTWKWPDRIFNAGMQALRYNT